MVTAAWANGVTVQISIACYGWRSLTKQGKVATLSLPHSSTNIFRLKQHCLQGHARTNRLAQVTALIHRLRTPWPRVFKQIPTSDFKVKVVSNAKAQAQPQTTAAL
jgi:hypothetical protein